MNRHLLAAMLAIPAAFSANYAMAQCSGCDPGVRWNGTQLNGLPTPGPILQGTQINGLPTPGPILQGTQISGIPTPGPILQGIQVDGFLVRNLETGSAIFRASYLMPATQQAPAWSALQVSRMTVHVAR